MSATPNTATPTPTQLASANNAGAGQPGAGSSQFAVPDGYVLARKDEHESTRRQAEQFNGVKPYYEKGSKYGIKSAEDWDRWGPFFETAAKRKLDPKYLAAMLSDEADADLNQQQSGKPEIDLDKRDEALMAKWRREQAEEQWRSGYASEGKLYEAAAEEIKAEFPDVPPFLLSDAIRGRAEQMREDFERGHPLHGQLLKPHGDGFKAKLSEFYKAEKAKHAGAAMGKKADAALKSNTTSPPAGNSGGQGKPKDEPTRRTSKQEIEDSVSQIFSEMS